MTRLIRVGAAGLVMALGLAACDLEVINPGATEDRFLDPPSAHNALIVGVRRMFGEGLGNTAYMMSTVTRENFLPRELSNVSNGAVEPINVNNHWSQLHRARWTAEDAIRRITQSIGATAAATSPLVLEAKIYAGYANRILGDVFCFAVIDEGPSEPSSVHWTRAETHFTEAMAIAAAITPATTASTNFGRAALAGRAQARLMLGQYAAAATDAAGVPAAYTFSQPYSAETEDTWNEFSYANDNNPYRRSTVTGTYFDTYYDAMGPGLKDPRTPWDTTTAFPLAEVGNITWHHEEKYGPTKANLAKPIVLARYQEMQLIIAENMLRTGNRGGALGIMNARRAALVPALPAIPDTNDTEAWTALKLERFYELWLEGRSQPDHRRYAADGTPGPLPALLDQAGAGRTLCWPIAEVEVASNPNF